MEEVLVRFPTLGLGIFKQLDNEKLANCKKISRSWNYFHSQNRLMSMRRIQKYQESHVEFKDDWKKVVKEMSLETLKQLGIAVEDFYKSKPKRQKFQYSPLHVAAS